MKKIIILILLGFSLNGMSQTLVTAPLNRNSPTDTYPTHIDSLGFGGFMALTDTVSRDNIPMLQRKTGMVVVTNDSISWQLQGGLLNSDWVRYATNSSGGSGTDSLAYRSLTQASDSSYATLNRLKGVPDTLEVVGGSSQVNSDWNATSGVAQILNKPIITNAITNGIIDPLLVTWSGTGLVFDVSAGSLIYNNVVHNVAATQVTLDAADATNPRIDAFYVDSLGNVGDITGVAQTNPVAPQVTYGQFLLTTVLIPANATTPNINLTTIYDENTEWTTSSTGTGIIDFNNTANPYHLTKAIKVTSNSAGFAMDFTNPSGFDTAGVGDVLKLFLYTATALPSGYTFQFFSGTNAVSYPLSINAIGFGYNPATLSAYQNISIPFSAFTFTSPQYNILKITAIGADANPVYWDYIQVQSGLYQYSPTDYSNKVDSTTIAGGNEYWWAKGSSHLAGAVGGNSWNLTGNSGTTSSNFLGTADNQPLRFKINNSAAGFINTISTYNVSLGILGLPESSTGIKNQAFGGGALGSNTTGYNNSAVGYTTLYHNTIGNDNTANGWGSQGFNSSGIGNTSVGSQSMNQAGSTVHLGGRYNSAFGFSALADNWNNIFNIGIGYNAGDTSTASNTLYISDSTNHMHYKLDSAAGAAPNVIGKDASGNWHVYAPPSGSSGVQSVTGTTVDNTDPLNPVVNVPTFNSVADASIEGFDAFARMDQRSLMVVDSINSGTVFLGVGNSDFTKTILIGSEYSTGNPELSYSIGGSNGIVLKADSITGNNTLYLPSANGTLVATINGLHPNSAGDITVSGGGSTYTASNGLTMVGNDVQLGGALTSNTTIATDNFSLTLITSITGQTPLIITSLNGGSGLSSTAIGSTGTVAVGGNTDIGYGVQGYASGAGTGLGGYVDGGGLALELINNSSDVNTVLTIGSVKRETSGTAADGIGASLDFDIETNDGAINLANRLISKFTTADDGSQVSEFSITGVNNAVEGNILRIGGNGNAQLYGTVQLMNYTVATLPTGVQGMTAYCTDLLSPTYLGVAVGGGAIVGIVFYNGTSWVTQ